MDVRHIVALLSLLALTLFAAVARAADPVAARPSQGCSLDRIEQGRRLEGRIDVGGVRRDYLLDVPDSVRPHAPAPLLLDFHGFGHSGAGVWQVSGFRDLSARAGFITVYPEGLPVRLRIGGEELERAGLGDVRVDGNRDLAFVRALLDDLERRYCIDRSRVFATGFSNGAFFSALLGCAMSDRIAAVAPVSGGPLRVACTPARGVPDSHPTRPPGRSHPDRVRTHGARRLAEGQPLRRRQEGGGRPRL